MTSPRFLHTATLLPNGKVLVAGGCYQTHQEYSKRENKFTEEQLAGSQVSCAGPLASAELYDPAKRRWSGTGAMSSPKEGHFAVLLPSKPRSQCGSRCGKVLVVGYNMGLDRSEHPISAELYDPSNGRWAPATAPSEYRGGIPVVMPSGPKSLCGLHCGKVLMVSSLVTKGILDIYDPASGAWEKGAEPPFFLNGGHTSTLLDNGRMLVLGGFAITGSGGYRLNPSSPAIYDPLKNAWSLTAEGGVFRESHTATALKDGRVLVAGGKQPGSDAITRSVELFSVQTKKGMPLGDSPGFWKATRALATARHNHVAVALKDGRVLVLGGDSTRADYHGASSQGALPQPEIYDPSSAKWIPSRAGATYRGPTRPITLPVFAAVRLVNGQVLVMGGISKDDTALKSAEIFVPGRVRK